MYNMYVCLINGEYADMLLWRSTVLLPLDGWVAWDAVISNQRVSEIKKLPLVG